MCVVLATFGLLGLITIVFTEAQRTFSIKEQNQGRCFCDTLILLTITSEEEALATFAGKMLDLIGTPSEPREVGFIPQA